MRFFSLFLSCCLCALIPSVGLAQTPFRPASVAVSSLALPDVGPWGAAALPPGIAPLSSDLWRGSDPGTLGVAFGKLSPDQRFPSLQVLVRQAIFSGGVAPTTEIEIARTRFDAANRFGPSEAAARLIFGVPQLSADGGLTLIAIDAGFRAGRTDEACGVIEGVPATAQGVVWLESRATCYALNNEPDAANLSADLAKSRGLTDTWLSRAIASVAGPITAPPPFRTDSGRALALSLRAKLKPPLTLATINDGAALSALLENAPFMEALAPEERLAMASNAAMRGTAPPQSARRALLTAGSEPVDPAAPPAAPVPTIPAQLSARILAAKTLQARSVEARLAIDDLRAIMASQPGLLTLSDVPVLTEAALWAGDSALAYSIAALSPTPLDSRLWLVMAIYDPIKQPQFIQQMLDAASSDGAASRVTLRDVAIGWSAGMPIGAGVSSLIQQGLPWSQAGNSGIRLALDMAADRGSKGEVALLVGLALQGEEPVNINAETLISAVRALKRVGLEGAAKDLARDYLLANYITLPATRRATPVRTPAATPRRAPAPTLAPAPAPVSTPRPATRPVSAPVQQPRPPAVRAPSRPTPPSTPRQKPSWGNR
jgi:hypothetical protein